MSGEKDVFLGLPQCTVLAAILFAIMISDIDDIEDIQRIFTRLLNQLSHSNLMFCLLFDPSDSILPVIFFSVYSIYPIQSNSLLMIFRTRLWHYISSICKKNYRIITKNTRYDINSQRVRVETGFCHKNM